MMNSTEAGSPLQEVYEYLRVLEIMCNLTVLNEAYPDDGKLYCNATFDGFGCWNYTLAGTRSYGKCPSKIFKHKTLGRPFKDCRADGSWWTHPKSGEPWTNYTPCENTYAKEMSLQVLNVYFSGYIISIIFLLIALFIFSCFKQIKNLRTKIHKNLFLSYLLTGIAWTAYYISVPLGPPSRLDENPVWCRILHVLTQYLTVCNYAWMFSEGILLHSMIVITFNDKRVLSKVALLIGWVVPLIPILVYTLTRMFASNVTGKCWTEETHLTWIVTGPIALSLMVNFIFLINITRILLTKLRGPIKNKTDSFQTKRAVKVCLILIPLFGLQYLLIPIRPADQYWLHMYDILTAVLISYQGSLVSILFCFINTEVTKLLKRKARAFHRRLERAWQKDDDSY